MSAFKDNLEEQRVRRKYQKEHFWAIFIISGVIGLFFLGFLGFSEQHWVTYLFYVPNFGETMPYYIIALFFLLGYRWWWFGLPSYITWVIEKIGKLANLLMITKIFSFILPSKETYEKMKKGKKEILNEFFYPKVTISDELARVSRLFYFYTKRHNIKEFFNFTALKIDKGGVAYDENGTNRIINLFRDKEREALVRKIKDGDDPKKVAKTKEVLARRDEKYKNTPSNAQELIYRDLFLVIEGVLKSYDGESDSIKKVKLPSPLVLEFNQEDVVGAYVNDKVDVFKDGKVLFSLDMIMDTVKNMTILYVLFLKRQYGRQSRFVTGEIGKQLKTEDGLREFEDFFKIVFLRRLLLNYGAIPSGWMCVRIESYDLRAIMSAIDRPLIPTITSINDGSNKSFNSDVKASIFLFTYWAFFREKIVSDIMDDLDWCFNTTKDYNEIRARELSSQSATEEI